MEIFGLNILKLKSDNTVSIRWNFRTMPTPKAFAIPTPRLDLDSGNNLHSSSIPQIKLIPAPRPAPPFINNQFHSRNRDISRYTLSLLATVEQEQFPILS